MENKEKLNSKREGRPEDLDCELLGKEVEVVLKNGGVLRGRVVSTSSYWVKIESSSIALYINKPFIVYVRVLEGHVERPLRATSR
jgi:sRNA-binding regulator protein Hfq